MLFTFAITFKIWVFFKLVSVHKEMSYISLLVFLAICVSHLKVLQFLFFTFETTSLDCLSHLKQTLDLSFPFHIRFPGLSFSLYKYTRYIFLIICSIACLFGDLTSAVAAVVCLRCFSKVQYFHAFHVNTGHPTLSGGLNILINNTIISSMLTIKLFFMEMNRSTSRTRIFFFLTTNRNIISLTPDITIAWITHTQTHAHSRKNKTKNNDRKKETWCTNCWNLSKQSVNLS